jgi:hypothetical protein
MTATTYPVRVEAALDARLSRWRWLIKWFLAIPHYVVLALLWIAFVVLSLYAFFAILITGRYPRAVFDFNVGVLRWTWRVHYYAFGALATDRYPPFTLDDAPDYPAHLEISYPEHLSRGLVLVKWWLLAIPHYLVVGLFLGGGTWLASRAGDRGVAPGGLIGLLALIAVVILAFTGRYPKQIYDFLLGLNRWVLRVAAYAALMTDAYPPFRLDMGGHELDVGGHEPGSTTLLIPPSSTSGPPVAPDAPPPAGVQGDTPPPGAPDAPPPADVQAGTPPPARSGWTGLRVTSVVIGSVLSLVAFGLLAGGGTVLWFDHHRDGGYVTTSIESHHSDGYAITSDRISLGGGTLDWNWERDLLGKVRIRGGNETNPTAVFVGIAPTGAVDRYLRDVPRTLLRGFGGHDTTTIAGQAAPAAPGSTAIWVAQASGTGQQTLTWTPRAGDWTVVVMNADATRGVSVTGDVGATVPSLPWVAGGLLTAGTLLMLAALLLVIVPVRRSGPPRSPSRRA